jgi:cytidylate kinase
MRRVLIVGGPGTGKTTLGRSLASALGVPHTDLDRLAYEQPAPGAPFWQWTQVPDDRRRAAAQALAATDGWVADGLFAGWTAPLRDAADTIVWLDLPAAVATWRVVRRATIDRLHGGRDWDLRSIRRVARGARAYRSRPAATDRDLEARDSANSTRTLTLFLEPATTRLVHCRTPAEVRAFLRRT